MLRNTFRWPEWLELFMQSPKLKATMSKYGGDKDKVEVLPDVVEKYTLQLSLTNADSNKSIGSFFNLLKGLDNHIVESGVTNSKAWFKKQHDAEVIREFYSSAISYPKDKITGEIIDKYPPTFRLGVQVLNGKIKTDCFDENDKPIEVAFPIEKGTNVTAIMQCSSLWFAGSKVGLSLRPVALRVVASPMHLNAFAFADDGDDTDAADATDALVMTAAPSQLVQSSDDEDEDDGCIPVAAAPTAVVAVPEPDADVEDEEPVIDAAIDALAAAATATDAADANTATDATADADATDVSTNEPAKADKPAKRVVKKK